MKNKFLKWLSLPYIVWAVGFTIIPLIMVFYYGLTDKNGAFTLNNVLAIGQTVHYKALFISLLLSFISTLICLLISYPLAMILAGMNKDNNKLLILIFILPM